MILKWDFMNLKAELERELKVYNEFKNKNIKLDISRGKPASEQIDFVSDIFQKAESENNFYMQRKGQDKLDVGNYGLLAGISELRHLFADLLDLEDDNLFIGGNSSLNLMYDLLVLNIMFGNQDSEMPWGKLESMKMLCPSPGYDRHFMMAEHLGFDLISVPMREDGPDMDIVESLVANFPNIKGIWCTPLYSNPDGFVYSDKTVERLAKMEAAKDFRLFWDNAYFTHHLVEGKVNRIANIIKLSEQYGNPNRVYQFSSTSKITFPGGGVSLIASSKDNIDYILSHFKYKTISYDKMNMYRHALVFKTKEDVESHMEKLAKFNRPKFDLTLSILEKELKDYKKYLFYTKPEGGYFVSLYTMSNCAKKTYNLCKDAGLIMTTAGDTFPYGIDPNDSHLRIAPTFPDLKELENALKLFATCVKIAILEELINKQDKASE